MSTVVNITTRRPIRRGRPTINLAMVAEITDALDSLGGHAHRNAVIECIALKRGLSSAAAHEALRAEVLKVFQHHCTVTADGNDPAIFKPTFGPDSYRWSLTREFVSYKAAARN